MGEGRSNRFSTFSSSRRQRARDSLSRRNPRGPATAQNIVVRHKLVTPAGGARSSVVRQAPDGMRIAEIQDVFPGADGASRHCILDQAARASARSIGLLVRGNEGQRNELKAERNGRPGTIMALHDKKSVVDVKRRNGPIFV